MNRKIFMGLAMGAAIVLVLWSCDNQPVQVPPPPVQVPPPMTPPGMPGAPGVPAPPGVQPPGLPPVPTPTPAPVAEPPLPRTELIPVADVEEPEPDKEWKGKKSICKLPGPELPEGALNGNYQCALALKNMPFGIKPPPTGCYIQGKSLKSKARDPGITINIAEMKATGFFAAGTYKFKGNELKISACMKAKSPGKYSGSGKGILNGDKKNKAKFTLTMTKQ